MNDKLKAILEGAAEGAKEAPREFFAPVIAFFNVMHRATQEVMNRPTENEHAKLAAHQK